MEIIYDPSFVQDCVERHALLHHLQQEGLTFSLFHYEKGELAATPDEPLEYLMFVTGGTVQIYGITESGEKSPLAVSLDQCMLGDAEFCGHQHEPFFVEAHSDLYCIAVPISPNYELLNQDVPFLRYLTQSLAFKLELISYSNVNIRSVEEGLLYYMREIYPQHTLTNVGTATIQLRCSRRQLQRVLKKLCDTGQIEKVGKGRYRLLQAVNESR